MSDWQVARLVTKYYVDEWQQRTGLVLVASVSHRGGEADVLESREDGNTTCVQVRQLGAVCVVPDADVRASSACRKCGRVLRIALGHRAAQTLRGTDIKRFCAIRRRALADLKECVAKVLKAPAALNKAVLGGDRGPNATAGNFVEGIDEGAALRSHLRHAPIVIQRGRLRRERRERGPVAEKKLVSERTRGVQRPRRHERAQELFLRLRKMPTMIPAEAVPA
eukprot:scaffold414_cov144-Pinguiococcus_pyrenoidosus.AAC.4